MPSSPLCDASNRPLQLGREIARGGEGAVFEIAGLPDRVAKKYHKTPTLEVGQKLRAMAGMARPELLKVAAWPETTLHDGPGGPVIGLMMRKVIGFREIHTLYSPASRRIHYPHVNWKFLLMVAYNCAAAFDELHKHGVVVGDVNQSNLLVSDQAQVVFIDCDSCQVVSNGKTYTCDVGVDLFTPPELQGRSFRAVTRTINHDLFGLAVLTFHLLFMGRHPFSGRYLGSGDMPIEKAIREFRFAYGQRAPAHQMAPPLHSLPFVAVPVSVTSLFERSFGPGSEAQGARPTATEWCSALKGLLTGLSSCPICPGHTYPPALPACPWCQLSQQGGPDFFVTFPSVTVGQAAPVFVLAAVWARIEKVAAPQFQYQRLGLPPCQLSPWPANLPQSVARQPAKPGILSSSRPQPLSTVAVPTIQPTHVPHSDKQHATGLAALACACGVVLLFGVAFLMLVAGAVSSGRAQSYAVPTAVAFLGFLVALPGGVAGAWWLIQERRRLAQERDLNREYNHAQARYRRAIVEEREEWQRQVVVWRERARREYSQQMQEWERIAAAMQAEAKRIRLAHRQAGEELWHEEQELQSTAGRLARAFADAKGSLEQVRSRYQSFDAEYQRELLQLQARARDLQLAQYLSAQLIEDAQIDKIGVGRKAALASFGIETALDVVADVVLTVPGFGPVLAGHLVGWRRSVEAQFVFDARQGVPAHERRALDQKYKQKKDPLERAMNAGEAQLQEIVNRGGVELQRLRGLVAQKVTPLAQAEANLRGIPVGL
jgi:DNA-binding helix-hairpin-helix protein with protein kinase domain